MAPLQPTRCLRSICLVHARADAACAAPRDKEGRSATLSGVKRGIGVLSLAAFSLVLSQIAFPTARVSSLKRRFRLAGAHLGTSALVAALGSLLVLGVWYPSPFATLAGGTQLFSLLVCVDMVMGPVLTAVAASPNKCRTELVRDLSVIVVLQLAAFGYGLYSMALARPVVLAFEVDLMRVVSGVEVDTATLSEAPPSLRALPWTGPRLIAAVKPTDPGEQVNVIQLGLAGFHLAQLPRYWRDFSSESAAAWRAARPIEQLVAKYPDAREKVSDLQQTTSRPLHELRFLPLVTRHENWVLVIAAPGDSVVGYLPLDGFF